jgi:hypothetical protein
MSISAGNVTTAGDTLARAGGCIWAISNHLQALAAIAAPEMVKRQEAANPKTAAGASTVCSILPQETGGCRGL